MFSSSAAQVSTAANYIEDVFSTYLYTGNGATQTITNGIDLSGKGGLVWTKPRAATGGRNNHGLFDTVRGAGTGSNPKSISSNLTDAELTTSGDTVSAFSASGFEVTKTAGAGSTGGLTNTNAINYVAWTFRKQAKFFDIVTYTGDGTSNRNISHNLGSTPGCVIVKCTSSAGFWAVWHRGGPQTNGQYACFLNSTGAYQDQGAPSYWGTTLSMTSTTFSVGANSDVNANGSTYVAYLFAHDAGGFGVSGSDNVISCGSFTTDGSGNATVSLGYEPQWCMFKRAVGGTSNWTILDNMRGWPVGGNDNQLQANTTGAETSASDISAPNATGFSVTGIGASSTYIYIAIRRGPMKNPTSGTSVFAPVNYTGTASSQTITTGITSDWVLSKSKNNIEQSIGTTRLSGFSRVLSTTNTNAEVYIDPTYFVTAMNNTAYNLGPGDGNNNTYTYTSWNFRRAPGFFDVVCYTGTGVAGRTISHNLGVVPELMIVRERGGPSSWAVYASSLGNTKYLILETTAAAATDPVWNNTTPTASVFSVNGNGYYVNNSGDTYVAYLFATVAGVSKVGSYTGTAALQTINCAFTSGARFVLIKRTDSSGDWYVWDSARGISSGNDPYLLLNSTAAEVTGTNYVDTTSVGFQVTAAAPAGINASGGSYIFLAVS